MPIFKISDESSKKELFKKYMNEKYDIELIFNFYWKNLSNDNKVLVNHPLLSKKLLRLSEEFFIAKSKSGNKDENTANFNIPVPSILYKNLIPLDLSPESSLFMKFMKFHLGFIKFSQWYKPNDFSQLEVNETIMKDYLTRDLVNCMRKK